jgi:hypothetical protein
VTDAEITKLAAEKVMGWNVVPFSDDTQYRQPSYPAYFDMRGRRIMIRTSPDEYARDFLPLTSDADAFMPVDAMEARGYDFRIHGLPSGASLASFVKAKEPGECDYWGDGPDRRRAIVLACLRAVGVEVG